MQRFALIGTALAALLQSSPIDFPTDLRVRGTVIPNGLVYPNGSILNEDISAGAAIAASKVQQQCSARYFQPAGTNVAAQTAPIHVTRGAGTVEAVEVVPLTVPTGDYTYTVDVQRSTGAAAFASVLSAPVTVNSSSVTRTVQAGTVSLPTLADGDSLQIVVAASGSSGTQGQGFAVVVTTRETP